MIRMPQTNGKHRRASILDSSFRGRRNRAPLVRQLLVSLKFWETNAGRMRVLSTVGTAPWPT